MQPRHLFIVVAIMPSKKGSQSKDQQSSQSQQQAPPPPSATSTATVAAKQLQDQSQQMSLLQENADPVNACMSVVDRKVRNLDKRKVCVVILWCVWFACFFPIRPDFYH